MSTKSILNKLFTFQGLRRQDKWNLVAGLGVACACLGGAYSARAVAPVFPAIPNQTVLIDEPTDAYQLQATDAESSKTALVFRGYSSNPTLVSTNNIFYGVAVGENYITVTPTMGQTGTCTITNVVRDEEGLEATNTFTFTVNATPAGYTRWTNYNAITIPSTANLATNANPYPSTITVSGATGWITNMTLTFSRFWHTRVQDVNMLLVAPNGTGVVLFAEISGQNRGCTNVTVKLADSAPYPLPPDFALWSEPLTAQDFQGGGYFPGIPWTNGPVAFSAFNGASPNGNWKLYVYDDTASNNGGILGGWSMKIATSTGPVISGPALTNRSIAVNGDTGALPFVISDPDTALTGLTLVKSSSNTNLVPLSGIVFGGSSSSSNRTVTVTPATAQSGSSTITVGVTDGSSNTNYISFLLTVGAVGNAPTISAIPNKTTLSGRAVGPFDITIGDAETPVGNLTLSATSSNTNLVSTNNIIFFNSGVTTLTLAPTDGATGSSLITVFVTDEANNTTSTSFTMTVNGAGSGTGIFDNASSISIPTASAATTYPSTINVSGMGNAISNLTLTLKGITHSAPNNLEMMLVGPGGQKSVFFAHVGGGTMNNVAVTVDDSATYQLPPSPYATLTGTYKSADFGHGTFPGGAPSGPYGTDLINTFVGAQANGTWSLYVINDPTGTAAGTIAGGWSLAITTPAALNASPTISDITDQSIAVNGTTGALPFTIGDTETPASSLVLTKGSSNPTLVPTNNIVFGGSGANRTVTVNPATGQSGTSVITVFVSDGTNTTSDSFVVSVGVTGNAPTISAIPDKATLLGRAVGPFNITIGDVETPVSSLILSASSSNTNLVSTNNIIFFNSGVTTLTVAPTDGVTGTSLITVFVKDEANNTTSTSFTLTVNGPSAGTNIFNNASSISIPTGSAATTYPSTINVSGMGNAISNLTLTLKGITHSAPNNLEMMLVGPGGQKSVFFAHVGGGTMNNVTVTVDDSATYQLPPSPYATLTGTYQSADFGHDTFPGGAPSGPYGNNLANTFIGAQANGTWSLYILNDPTGTAAGTIAGGWSLAITTPVAANTAPTISDIADQNIAVNGTTGALPFTINDAETPAASLVLTKGSSNPTLVPTNNIVFGGSASNRTVTVTPASGQSGASTITVFVSDGTNITSDSFVVSVGVVGNAPTIAAIPDKTTLVGRAVGPFNITIGDVETPVSSLILSASSSNTNLVSTNNIIFFNSGVTTLTVAPTDGVTGTSVITIFVTDGANNTTSTSFTLTVNGAGSGIGIFNNTNSLSIPTASAASTYPSTISVSGMGNTISNLTLTLKRISHNAPNNLEMLLVGPGGQKSVFFAHVGGGTMNDVTVTVDDSATYQLPPSPYATLTGTYQSADFGHDTFPGGAPSGPYGTNLANTFIGATANGTWSLYVINDPTGTAAGTIAGGWSLAITTPPPPTAPPTITTIANQSIAMNTSTGPIPFTIGDPDTSVSSLVLTSSSANPTLVPTNNIVFGGSGANRTVTVTPATGLTGVANLGITVSDGVNSTNASFTVTVTAAPVTRPFTNTTPIIIPDVSPASPYPSTINVSGMNGMVSNITVTLRQLNHEWGRDMDIVLVSPSGQKAIVMSDCGTGATQPNINMVFTDSAVSNLLATGSLTAGTYKPTDYDQGDGDLMPAPCPAGPYATNFATFANTVADGAWSLYVADDGPGQTGRIAGGWSITITAVPNTPPSISDIANQTIAVNGNTGALPFTIADQETAAGSLTLTVGSSNPALVPTNSIVLGGSGGNRTVTVTPTAGLTGTSTITITVSDGVNTTSDTFLLTVDQVGGNTPPYFTSPLPDRTNLVGRSAGPFDIFFTDNETPNSLTVAATSSNTNLVPVDNIVFYNGPGQRTLTVTPVDGVVGTTTITVTTGDGTYLTSDTFTFTTTLPSPLQAIFDKTGSITLPTAAVASSYPSTLTVAGVPGNITDVTLTLKGLSHSVETNLQMLLVGPAGQKVVVMAKVGGGSATNLTVTLDDASTYALPPLGYDILPGTYRPSDGGHLAFSGPAPGEPYATTMAAFDGTSPNGDWSLYMSTTGAGSGALANGWSLAFTTDATNTAPTITAITPKSTVVNTPTTAIPFTIFDAQTTSSNLLLMATSGNTNLVPNANLLLAGGTGTNRTLTVTPRSNVLGTATITVGVSDGVYSTNTSFVLTVNPAPLVVTPGSYTRLYGQTNPILTGTIVGLQAGDNITANYFTSATTNSPVGIYTNTFTLNDPGNRLGNYLVTTNVGYLTNTPAPLTVLANSTNKVYGTNRIFLKTEFSILSGALYNGNTLTNVTLLSAGTNITAVVGAYPIVPTNAAGIGLTGVNPLGQTVTNYSITYSNGTMTVTPAPLSVLANSTNKAYGTNRIFAGTEFTITNGALFNGNTLTSVTLTSEGTNAAAPVGVYPITPSAAVGSGLANYAITYNPGTLTVTPAPLTVTANSTNKVYGTNSSFAGTEFLLSGALFNGNTLTNVTLTSAGTNAAATVGTYPIVPSAALGNGLTNYTINYTNGTLTVTPAALTVTASSTNKVYGGTQTFAGTEFSITSGALYNGNTLTSVSLTSAGSAATTPVGIYPITAASAGGTGLTNYSITYSNGTLTVETANLSISAASTNKAYGVTLTPTEYTVAGLLNADTVTNLTLASAGSVSNAAVGSYPITASGALGTGLTNYSIGYNDGTLTVASVNLFITAASTNKVYGATLVPTDYSVAGLLNGDTVTNVTLASAGSVSNAPVGGYAINASAAAGVGLSNYTIGYSNGTLTVGAANLVILPGSTNKVYGTTLNPLDYSATGLLNGDTVTNVTLASAGSVSNAPVGSYPITASSALGIGLTNYLIGYSNGTLTVDAANLLVTAGNTNKIYGATLNPTAYSVTGLLNDDSVTGVTLTSAGSVSNATVGAYAINASGATGLGLTNYNIGYSNGTLSVGAASLSITASSTNKAYGTTFSPVDYSVAGLLNGDVVTNVTLVSAGSVSNAPVGVYPIDASSALGIGLANYTIGYNSGSLTVGVANLVITAGSTNKVYGVTLNPTAYSVSGLLAGDSVTNVTLASAGSVSNAPAGSYAINASSALGMGLTNYTIGYNSGTLTVGAANLSITAASTNKAYGATLTPTEYSVTGLLNGDTVTNVTLASAGTVSNAPVGSYTINASAAAGIGLTNYIIGYNDGTLTVGAASLLITAGSTNKVYGATLNPADYSVTGLLNGDSVTNVTLASAGSVSNASVGAYAINASSALGIGLTNYTIGYSNGTLTVSAASLLITAGSTNKVYGATLNPADYNVAGLLNGDVVTNVTLASTGSISNAPVGAYPITAASALGIGLGNYTIGYTSGTLTVGAANLLITAGSTNKVYGATLNPADYSVAGLLNGDTVTNVTLASAGSLSNAPVGSYPIIVSSASGTGLTNYSIGYNNGTLTVGAANLLITAGSTNKVYGATLNPADYSVTGLLVGDAVTNVTLASAGSVSNAPVGSYPITASSALGIGLTNYTIGYNTGTLMVGAANLVITAGSTNKVYGATLTPIGYSAIGLFNGDTVTNVTLASAGSVSNAPVGSYPITASAALGVGLTNYTIGYSNGTLAVGAANLLITASSTNKVYGATLTPTGYSAVGLLNGDSVTNVTLASGGSVSNAPVGSYAINASAALGVGLTNYTIGYSNGTLTVGAASLLITAGSTNKVYGTTLNPTGYSVAGLLNGDSVTNVTMASAGSVSNAAVGSYAINVSAALGVGLTNYTIGYSNGTLTVGAANLLVTANNATKTQGTTLTFTGTEFTTTGLLNGDAVLSVSLSSAGADGSAAAGIYPIVATNAVGTGLTNYTIAYANGTLTVTNASAGVLFQITSITLTNGVTTITWNSVSNQNYRLQYKDSFTDTNWTDAPATVLATGASTSTTNVVGAIPQRFYRVKAEAQASVPRPQILSITASNSVVTVTWSSVASHFYRLQYKDDFSSTNWTDVLPEITAAASTSSGTNSVVGVTQRYYRVWLRE